MRRLVKIFRSFKNNPGLTFINVISMAFGLVTAGIIMGYVYQEFNYDSEIINASKIYRIIQKEGSEQQPYTFAPLAQSLKSNYPEIEEALRVSFFYGYLACLAGEKKFNEDKAIFADPEFFSMFSFPLLKGNPKECLSSPNSIVISEKAAKKYFDDEDPIGKQLQIGKDKETTVTGVFRDFDTHSNFKGDLILPLHKISKLTQIWIEPSWNYESDIHTFVLISQSGLIEELSAKARKFVSEFTQDRQLEILFQPLSDIHINNQLGWESTPKANVKYLNILLVVALLILCISVINFMFLYIGTALRRSLSIGIKKVCGATKMTLVFEYFAEVVVLMMLSVVAATGLFLIYTSWLTSLFPFLPSIQFFDYNVVLLLFVVASSVTFLAAIYPSVILSSFNPVRLFRKKILTRSKFKLVNVLVIGQLTICMALMVFTFMMQKQTRHMINMDTGYAMDELVTIPLNMHVGEGIFNERFEAFTQELKKYPGIKNVSLSYSSPSSIGTGAADVYWEGKPDEKEIWMNWESVSYDYFETIGVQIKLGRSYKREFQNDEKNWDSRQGAFILNERAIHEMGIEDPIGKEFGVWNFRGPIVGVVEDYNFKSMHSGVSPMFYMMDPFFLNEIVVRIDPTTPSTLKDIKTVWDQFVIDYPLEVFYVNNQVRALYDNDQNLARLLHVFSLLAILIASMGLFSLTVMSMDQRIKEIGIRKVNGAKSLDIFTMFNREYLRLVGIAFVLATTVSWYAILKWLDNFAYKTQMSWWVFGLAGALVLGIALITVSWKSWQVAEINPVETLRHA